MNAIVFARRTLAAIALYAFIASAFAFPIAGRPIRLIVPFPPGGAVFDGTARLIAQKLGESLQLPVVVENRPGAGAVVGNHAVASAAADGHTLLYGAYTSLTLLPHQLTKRPYDEFRDLTPITHVARSPLFLIAHPSVPANGVKELLVYAKANPGRLAFGSWQFGGLNHIYLEMLNTEAGADMIHVPYKGVDDALKDLLEGRIQLMMGAAHNHVAFVRSGKLRALGAASGRRMRGLEDVPTFSEQGLKGYEHVGGIAIFGPGGTPPATVRRLNQELSRLLRTPEVVDFFVKAVPTFEVEPSTPEQLAADLRKQYEEMGPVIRQLGIRID